MLEPGKMCAQTKRATVPTSRDRYGQPERQERQELLRTLLGAVKERETMETLRDDVTEETRAVFKRGGKATTDLIREVLRDGMDTRKTSSAEKIYKYNNYVIMDVSWGQYTRQLSLIGDISAINVASSLVAGGNKPASSTARL